jgi:hypothetical protein
MAAEMFGYAETFCCWGDLPPSGQQRDLNPGLTALLFASSAIAVCQGSSVVEQGTHKPLVGSSTLPPGTTL